MDFVVWAKTDWCRLRVMKNAAGHDYGNLSERVVLYLVKYIRDHDLKGGDKVPSEVQVTAGLKISRGVVRQAYQSLRTAGILEIAMGRSPRVGRLNDSAFTQMLQHAVSTEQVMPEQVLELRCAVEVHAAELAALNRTPAQIQALRRTVEGMRQAQHDMDRFVRHDVRFHELIGKATGNRLFEIISSALRGALEASIRAGMRSQTTHSQIVRIVETHEAIVDAIEASQATRARNVMAVHFDEAKNALQLAARASHRNAS